MHDHSSWSVAERLDTKPVSRLVAALREKQKRISDGRVARIGAHSGVPRFVRLGAATALFGLGLTLAASAQVPPQRDQASAGQKHPPALHVENDFSNVTDASIAGDRQHLWLAVSGQVTGEGGRENQAATYELTRQGWRAGPDVPGSVSGESSFKLAATRGRPCLGFTEQRVARVLCERSGQFAEVADPGSKLAGASLEDLVAWHHRLCVLVRSQNQHRVYVHRHGRWEPVGKRIAIRSALLALGTGPTTRPRIGLIALTGDGASRSVLRPSRTGRWTRVGPTFDQAGLGPLLSGPVTAHRSLMMPVVDADSEPWRFYAVRRRHGTWKRCCGGNALNQTQGNAQGGIYRASGEGWAGWQEDRFLSDGRFASAVYAQRINGRSRHPQRLWHGKSIGPGPEEVASGLGRPFALYSRSNPDNPRETLTVRVRPIAAAG